MTPDPVLRYAARLVFVLTTAAGITACGGSAVTSPTSPTTGDSLRAGDYTLSIASNTGGAATMDAPCTPRRERDSASRVVQTRITFARDGEGWLGRSSSAADGDLEVRLRDAGVGQAGDVFITGGIPVAGTVRGAAVDDGGPVFLLPRDARVLAHGMASEVDAQLVGEVKGRTVGLGSLNGMFTYADGTGASTTCRGGTWTLLPVSPFP